MQNPWISLGGRASKWSVVAVCFAAACAGAYEAWLVLGDPFLGSDSGFRVFFAHRPVVKIGNRVWLPFLQGQIWLYHLLGLPFAGVKLITVAYTALAAAFLGLYWRCVLGAAGARSTLLAVAAAVCFSAHFLTIRTGELMQEPVGVSLFFAFLLLASAHPRLRAVALVVAAAALLTRDSYWIYLFAITLVGIRALPWSPRRLVSYAALWAVPIVWLAVCIPTIYLIAYGRLPTMPIEWPLMYNPVGPRADQISSAESLWRGLVGSRTLPLAGGVVLAAAALFTWRRARFLEMFDHSEFSATLIRSAPIAAAIVYALILIFDPWQVTPGNGRAAWPLLEMSYAVAPWLIRAAADAPRGLRALVIVAVAGGLVGGIYPDAIRSRDPMHAFYWSEQDRLKQAVSSTGGPAPASICIRAIDRWVVFQDLNAALFHETKLYLDPGQPLPEHCDFVIIQADVGIEPANSLRQVASIATDERQWVAYQRGRSP